jgi:predicted ferric reductase
MLSTLLLGAVDKKLAWYISRAGGLVAWAVVTASIIWGLALSTRLVSRRGAPAWLLDLHRYLGALSLVFTAVHIVSLPFDNYAHITVMELLIPFRSAARSGYAPEPLAWGVVAFYLVVAIQLTSWIKKHLSRRVWHSIHLLSAPLFVIATVHGYKAGTEKNNRFIIWSSIAGGLIFFFLLLFRLFSKIGDAPKRVRSKTPVSVLSKTPESETL